MDQDKELNMNHLDDIQRELEYLENAIFNQREMFEAICVNPNFNVSIDQLFEVHMFLYRIREEWYRFQASVDKEIKGGYCESK